MKPLKIACLGEAMIELDCRRRQHHATLGVAGDSMNTAIYLKRSIGPEHDVSFVSMVGRDPLSNRIADFISQEGVSTRLLKRHTHKLPGIYSISTNDVGERSFSYWRDSSAARMMFSSPEGLTFDELDSFDVIFASAISLAILPQSVRDQFFNWIATFDQPVVCLSSIAISDQRFGLTMTWQDLKLPGHGAVAISLYPRLTMKWRCLEMTAKKQFCRGFATME